MLQYVIQKLPYLASGARARDGQAILQMLICTDERIKLIERIYRMQKPSATDIGQSSVVMFRIPVLATISSFDAVPLLVAKACTLPSKGAQNV